MHSYGSLGAAARVAALLIVIRDVRSYCGGLDPDCTPPGKPNPTVPSCVWRACLRLKEPDRQNIIAASMQKRSIQPSRRERFLTPGSGRHTLKPTGAPVVLQASAGGGVSLSSARRPSASLVIVVLLTGCASFSLQPTGTAPKSTPVSSPTATPAPSRPTQPASTRRVSTPTERPLPTPPPCTRRPGRIAETEVVDKRLPRSLPIRVYLPACYDALLSQRYPAIYLLHGLTYTDSQWDDLGVDEAMDAMTKAGTLAPAIIVMPWERTGINLEQAIPQILVPYVDTHYRTLPARQTRAIGGISRGGGWALRIGLLHPDLFAAVGLHSPGVLSPDLFRIPDWAETLRPTQMPRIWIDMGDRDTLRFDLADLRKTLDESAIPYEWHTYPGEHAGPYWSAHLETYLEWYDLGW